MRTNLLIVFYGTTGIGLLAVLAARQRVILRRMENLSGRIETMLLQVEQEARATAHVLGAEVEFSP